MKKTFRFVASLLLSLILLVSNVLPSFAAEWNGSTADGVVGGSLSGSEGYGIKSDWAINHSGPSTIMALRFSFYNADTGVTKGTTIDIYKSDYADYMDWNKLDVKYNKLQLKKLYNSDSLNVGLTTDSTNCYTEDVAELSLADGLPEYTSELAEWQEENNNLNAILTVMEINGVSSVYDFGTADYLLVEPVFPVYIDSAWFALTVTEMATHLEYITLLDYYAKIGNASFLLANLAFLRFDASF